MSRPTALRLVEPHNETVAAAMLTKYFDRRAFVAGHEEDFTGAYFEVVGHRWDAPATLDVFTPSDVLAPAMLSVPVPAVAAVRILGPDAPALARILKDIRSDIDLWDASPDTFGDGSAVGELWMFLRRYDHVGPVTTSKLMARKRARLVPVHDRHIGAQLGLGDSRGYTAAIQDLLLSGLETDKSTPVHARLAELLAVAGLPDDVTPLRALDVLMWLTEARPGFPGLKEALTR